MKIYEHRNFKVHVNWTRPLLYIHSFQYSAVKASPKYSLHRSIPLSFSCHPLTSSRVPLSRTSGQRPMFNGLVTPSFLATLLLSFSYSCSLSFFLFLSFSLARCFCFPFSFFIAVLLDMIVLVIRTSFSSLFLSLFLSCFSKPDAVSHHTLPPASEPITWLGLQSVLLVM